MSHSAALQFLSLLLQVGARFCVPQIGKKKQGLQSPVGQRVTLQGLHLKTAKKISKNY